jgi:antitoxin (DNA-binding transcriptional repressor) of toxin-antitoxin stability system
MEQARKKLAFLASRAAEGRSTLVTNHGRPYFAITPPGGAFMPDLAEIDQRLRDAINAGDDQALTELADEIEQAGLPLLAQDVRTRKSAGLRALLTDLLGSAT